MAVAHWKTYHWLGTEAAPPPTTPTLTINALGTLATVTGSTSGSVNVVKVVAGTTLLGGSYTWTAVGSRTGNGSVALSLTEGFYWCTVFSSTPTGTAVSALVYFHAGTLTSDQLHSPAYIVSKLLIALGKGLEPPATPWPVYATHEPPTPDQVITVYDTSPTDEGRLMLTGQGQGHFGIQIRVRAKDAKTGYPKAYSLYRTMSEQVYDNVVTIEGSSYLVHCLAKINEPLALGEEGPGSRRNLFTINAVASIRVLS